MRNALLITCFCAAFLALGEIARKPAACRTVVRFGRNGRWLTREGAMFEFLMSRP